MPGSRTLSAGGRTKYSKPCARDRVRSPKTRRCLKRCDKKTQYRRYPSKRCVLRKRSKSEDAKKKKAKKSSSGKKPCPSGKTRSRVSKRCHTPCKSGYRRSAKTKRCVKSSPRKQTPKKKQTPKRKECRKTQVRSPKTGKCRKRCASNQYRRYRSKSGKKLSGRCTTRKSRK